MNRRDKGNISEAKVLTYFIENGYDVFTPFTANPPYDLIISKDNEVFRVSVKSTSESDKNSWQVALRNYSVRRDGRLVRKYFDNTSSDILAVYIIPENRIVTYESKLITNKSTMNIKKVIGDI